MNILSRQSHIMRWILFGVFVLLFLVFVVFTLAGTFFGKGHFTEIEREFLFKLFIGEVGVSVIALFGVLFGFKKGKDSIPNGSLTQEAKLGKVYQPEEATAFYNTIADDYDERNTKYLLETHQKIIEIIGDFISPRDRAQILDLGGGTGRLIASHFFDRDSLFWHCIEQSPAMLDQFRRNLNNTKLETQFDLMNIFDIDSNTIQRTYDVILISLVLSSLPSLPNFTTIKEFLKTDGILIIADIDSVYTVENPLYTFSTKNNGVASLKTNPIHPLDIIEHLTSLGFILKNGVGIKLSNGTRYSFVLTFSH